MKRASDPEKCGFSQRTRQYITQVMCQPTRELKYCAISFDISIYENETAVAVSKMGLSTDLILLLKSTGVYTSNWYLLAIICTDTYPEVFFIVLW